MFIWNPIYIGQATYRLPNLTFTMRLYERTKVITRSTDRLYGLTFLQTQDIKSAELHKKCSYQVRNFDCSNLPNVCSVKFTNHSWRTEIRQHHSFISEAKPSSILPLPKDASSTFGLPPQIDFVTSKCRYTILWLPLFVPDNKCCR